MRKDYGKVPVTPKSKTKTKKELDTEWEQVSAAGEEGKKGIEQAKGVFKEQKLLEEEILKEQKTRMFDKRRTFFGYNETVARILYEDLQEAGIPQGWVPKIAHTSQGVILELESPSGRFYRSAFKTTGLPELDINAIGNFVIRALNTMEKVWMPHKDRK